jgi:DNA-binding MarR family transcriptional regulator
MTSDLETHLGYWLRFVSNHVSHAFSLKLQTRDVTVAEWVVLRGLFDSDSASPSGLADRLGMSRGAISKLADRLIAKELVERTASTEDRRQQALSLTADGRKLVPSLSALADRNDAEFFGHLKPAERAALEKILLDIVRRHDLKTIPTE